MFHDQSPGKNVAEPAGVEQIPPDHQSDAILSHEAGLDNSGYQVNISLISP